MDTSARPYAPVARCKSEADCYGPVSQLAKQYGGLNGASTALAYSSVLALQDAIVRFCRG